MDILEILNHIHPLSKEAGQKIVQYSTEIKLPKGHIILEADKTETSVYFIKKGIVRAFAPKEEKDITFWFGREGDPIVSMKSYVDNKPGYECVELLEDCELYEIKNQDLQQLFLEDISIANWGRKFAETLLLHTEERLISKLFKSAKERYLELLQDNPDFVQRIQLGYIASYLGITQVSLSRIRAEIK
ncbi:Crp/Fnr family transcriptional regulator [Flavobacterium gossypii]|nr:Crp/Fnr family transcriptional regulator [Flavobacterium gossypii]